MREFINLIESLQEEAKTFYHGSNDKLRVGIILKPRGDEYEMDWKDTDFYSVLEEFRPPNMLSHKDSVFMCDNPDDIDNAGGGTEWLFTVKPLGPVQRHDLNWGSEISMLLSEDEIDKEALQKAAENYWNGVPHYNESVWEYLTPEAKIITVEEY